MLKVEFNYTVLYLLGKPLIKSWAFACLAASIISSSVASGFPYLMFSRIDVAKSTGSYSPYKIIKENLR